MAKLALLLLFITASVGAVAALLAATDDSELLTSPPEMIAEQFMKQLENNRYDRALPFLVEDLRNQITTDDLENFKDKFEEQNGRIEDIHGEQGQIETDRATADADIKTDRGESSLTFTLVREKHEWKIEQLPEIGQ